MVTEIEIGKVTVEMVANAATPIRYRMLFGEDIIKVMLSQTKEIDTGLMADAAGKLAYVMSLQAAKSDFRKVNLESFMAWLEQFDPLDMVMAAGDIMGFYNQQMTAGSDPKKKGSELTAK